MSLSMYQASIPAFVQMLNNIAAILDKAEAHAGNRKIDPEVLLNYRGKSFPYHIRPLANRQSKNSVLL